MDRTKSLEWQLLEAQRIGKIGSWEYDVATDKATWSPESTRLFGTDPNLDWGSIHEVLARVAPPDRERVAAAIEGTVRHGQVFDIVFAYVGAEGSEVTLRARGERHVGEDGNLSVTGIVQDLTEQLHAQQALRASEARFRGYFELGAAGGLIADAEQRITHVNQRLCELLGVEAEQLIGRQLWELASNDQQAADRELLAALLAGTLPRHDGEVVISHTTGHAIEAWVSTVRAAAAVPGSWQILRTVENIGPLKEAERARWALEVRALASEKLESLGLLAGGVAHDFNNVLVRVMGYVELLKRDLPPHQLAQERLAEVTRASSLGAAFCNQLLVYAGWRVPKRGLIQLSEMIRAMAPLLRISSRQVQLEYELEDPLPLIRAEEGQLQQILMNLVMNAGEASEEGGRVTIRTRSDDKGVVLEVADHGSGMDDDTAALAFDPFFTTKKGGRGLGLASVKTIVDRLGGVITLESTLGKGTNARLVLGVCERPAEPAAQPRPSMVTGARVLIIDDQPLVRGTMGRMLEHAGFEVYEADDCDSALPLLDEIGVDVVLLTRSRRLSSATIERIGAMFPSLPVIVAGDVRESALRSSELLQPIGYDALVRAVSDALAATG